MLAAYVSALSPTYAAYASRQIRAREREREICRIQAREREREMYASHICRIGISTNTDVTCLMVAAKKLEFAWRYQFLCQEVRDHLHRVRAPDVCACVRE